MTDYPNDLNSKSDSDGGSGEISLRELQVLIKSMFGHKDEARGASGTYMWLMEEIGELAAALRSGSREELELEFADVMAWVVTLANISEVDLTDAIQKKYAAGCPRCGGMTCDCALESKP